MDPLRETMDALAESGRVGGVDLYGDLAAVYDFVSGQRLDYDELASFVGRHAPTGASAAAVGACGGGRLLSRLADRFDAVLGIDRSEAMLEMCRRRTDAPLVLADLASFVAPGWFDVYTVLGGSMAHVPAGGLDSLLERAHASLSRDGVFIAEFMEPGTVENGAVIRDTFDSDPFRVDRTLITTREGATAVGPRTRYAHAYEITDTRTGESVRTGTSTQFREFRMGAVLGSTLAAGFDDATIVTPPTHGAALVARRRD